MSVGSLSTRGTRPGFEMLFQPEDDFPHSLALGRRFQGSPKWGRCTHGSLILFSVFLDPAG
jgi:hypothetical protein